MNASFLCLGGNIGNRLDYLNRAKKLISAKCGKITLQSPVYETKAWGNTNSPDHLNQCIKLETELEAEALLHQLMAIENELGRKRAAKNDPRVIDIDILLFNDVIVNTENCTIPHPRMHLRNFVLIPLNDMAPDVIHPILDKKISVLLKECTDTLKVLKLYQFKQDELV